MNKKGCSRSELLSCYGDIARLSAAELKAVCRTFGIDATLPKVAIRNAVSHCVGITTTGGPLELTVLPLAAELLDNDQIAELQSLTPKLLYSIFEWSKDIAKVPAIDESDVKKYLLQSNVLTSASERTYKLSRPYQMRQFVHSVQYSDLPSSSSFGIIRAMCNPSQSTDPDDVKLLHVIIDKVSGQPYGGYCTCTVG